MEVQISYLLYILLVLVNLTSQFSTDGCAQSQLLRPSLQSTWGATIPDWEKSHPSIDRAKGEKKNKKVGLNCVSFFFVFSY